LVINNSIKYKKVVLCKYLSLQNTSNVNPYVYNNSIQDYIN